MNTLFPAKITCTLAMFFFFCAISIAPIQIYTFSVSSIFISLAFFFSYASFVIFFYRKIKIHPIVYPLFLFAIWTIINFFLKGYDPYILKILYYNAFYPALLLCAFNLVNYEHIWKKALEICLFFATCNAILIFIFRIYPNLESFFYALSVSKVFINPNTVDAVLLNPLSLNIQSFLKSGGLFPNANFAGVFSGVACLLGWSLYNLQQKAWVAIATQVLLAAMIVSGSKPAVAAAAVIALWIICTSKGFKKLFPVFFFVLGLSISLAGDVFNASGASGDINSTQVVQQSVQEQLVYTNRNAQLRLTIWKESLDAIIAHPVWGNSQESLESSQRQDLRLMQSHNVYLRIGVHLGLPAVLLVLWFHTGMLYTFIQAMRILTPQEKKFAIGSFLAFGWVIAASLLSNAEPVGEFHSAPILATMCGVTLGFAKREKERNENCHL